MRSSNTDPTYQPVHQLAAEIAARRLSPVDIVEAFLARIARLEGKLHAYIDVYGDDARLATEAADKAIRSGHSVGPLHGVPIALKDLIDLEGRVTTGGSVRLPASRCGLSGLKTTIGRVITYGILPLAPSLDTPGPMARSV